MTTEERIKAAARKVFHQKGYAGTRTRDIAEEAGIGPRHRADRRHRLLRLQTHVLPGHRSLDRKSVV